jgi:hypothetical protein
MSDLPDFDQFQSLLLDATRSAFTVVQQEHSKESFYAFSLFHEPLWGYVIPSSNTEEGLIRRAEHYKLDIYKHGYAKQSTEELAQSLRWNPADWAYHDETINPKMILATRHQAGKG